ncbi:hypothetical protein ACFL1B_01885 [Nanoarchaeota archaeon]
MVFKTILELIEFTGDPDGSVEERVFWTKQCMPIHYQNNEMGVGWQEAFKELPELQEGRILDAGAARLRTTIEIAKHYPGSEVHAMDYYEHRLDESQWKLDELPEDVSGRIHRVSGNFYYLEDHFPPGFFDIIFVMNNLTQVACNWGVQTNAGLAYTFRRALNEDGYLCITGCVNEYPHCMSAVMQKTERGFDIKWQQGFEKNGFFDSMRNAYDLDLRLEVPVEQA